VPHTAASLVRAGRRTLSDDRFTQTCYAHEDFAIGAFRCPREAGHFGAQGRAQRAWLAFPRTIVRIEHEGRRPVLADMTRVVLYNDQQHYRREMLDPRGDQCELFALPRAVVADVAAEQDPGVRERGDSPFACSDAPCNTAVYLRQRGLFRYVTTRAAPDPLYVAEEMITLLRAILPAALSARTPKRPARGHTAAAHLELVEETRRYLNESFATAVSLHAIASRVHASPFHLARVFKRATGLTLHEYVTQLRLRAALGELADRRVPLTELALAAGFSSHSHFSAAFRARFGLSPSTARQSLSAGDLREMSKILTADRPTPRVR
jgi:AraC-like DNA-binding protein